MTLTTDPRSFRADSILANAGQWIRVRTKDGRPLAFGVPSARDPNHVYLTTPRACTCPDAARGHRCKHQVAVAAYCQRRRAEQEGLGHSCSGKHTCAQWRGLPVTQRED